MNARSIIVWSLKTALVAIVILLGATSASAQEFTAPIYKDAVAHVPPAPPVAPAATTPAAPTATPKVASTTPQVRQDTTPDTQVRDKSPIKGILTMLAILLIIAGVVWFFFFRRRAGAGNHDNHGGHNTIAPTATPHHANDGGGHATPVAAPAAPAATVQPVTPAPAAGTDLNLAALDEPAPVAPTAPVDPAAAPAAPAAEPTPRPGAAPVAMFFLAVLLPAFAAAQTITPASIVMGYPAQEFKVTVTEPCIPTGIAIQNGVVVTNASRTNNVVTFNAAASATATPGPTKVNIKCADGKSVDVTPFAVLTAGENYAGAMAVTRLNNELKTRDASIAELRREVATLKAANQRANNAITAITNNTANFVTKTDLATTRSQVETQTSQNIGSVNGEINSLRSELAAAIKTLNEHSAAIADLALTVDMHNEAIPVLADNQVGISEGLLKAKVPGFLGIGSKDLLKKNDPERARLEASMTRIRELAARIRGDKDNK